MGAQGVFLKLNRKKISLKSLTISELKKQVILKVLKLLVALINEKKS